LVSGWETVSSRSRKKREKKDEEKLKIGSLRGISYDNHSCRDGNRDVIISSSDSKNDISRNLMYLFNGNSPQKDGKNKKRRKTATQKESVKYKEKIQGSSSKNKRPRSKAFWCELSEGYQEMQRNLHSKTKVRKGTV